MQLKTILNRVEKHKSFVYGDATLGGTAKKPTLEIAVEPRANGQPTCSGCKRRQPGYDRLPPRSFEFVPLWGIAVFLVYRMRRVDCRTCGVTVEQVPWSDGKAHLTITYQWFLARWARRLSWQETARVFHTSWDTVYRAVEHAVRWGLVHRNLRGIEAIGVDEVQWQRGHKYLTLVYQIDEGCRRLLYVARDRTEDSLRGFARVFPDKSLANLSYVCSDMWKPYLTVLAEFASQAIHVLDRFHIMKQFNLAIDEVRAAETRQLKADGYEPVLKHSRWCLLKRKQNLTHKQTVKLSELMQYNLQSVRSHLLREDFQRFWEYRSVAWAGKFLKEWCTRTMRSRIGPMKKVAGMLRRHQPLILNWFRAKGMISAGVVEGLNNKVKLTTRKSYGFRTYEAIEIALYHSLGALPEPTFTHDFC
jgi:transposase